MDRRSFLGRVIGLIAATQVPFRAEAVELPQQASDKLRRTKAMLRLFELTEAQLRTVRVYGVTVDGERFWAPAIKEVEIDRVNLKVRFVAEAIKMTCTIQCVGMGLVDDRKIRIAEKECAVVNMTNGDVLNMTYILDLNW